MATEMLQYLDPDGLDETVLNIGEIKTNLEGQIRDLGESIEEEMQDLPYARPDGVYPDMTVGAVIGADETSQWATRESTGSGAATVRNVQGASVVFQQKFSPAPRRATSKGITMVMASDGTLSLSGTATGAEQFTAISQLIDFVSGHKYIAIGPNSALGVAFYTVSGNVSLQENNVATCNATTQERINVAVQASFNVGDTPYVCYPQIFDLTQMFGAGNEPATVAEFEQMFPEAYYPYSEPTLKPVRIAGIASTDANGDALDSVEWEPQTLRAAGSVRDELTADELVTRVGVVDLGTLNWGGSDVYYAQLDDMALSGTQPVSCAAYPVDNNVSTYAQALQMADKTVAGGHGTNAAYIYIKDSAYTTAAALKTALNGVPLYYELATPTTTPISPALPMTYRVQQGGTEAIIVPDGEVSAAPIITVAEPINAGDEFARIWEAIHSLGYTRNAAQLSRPVSLTDIGSIDEVQKDTAEIAEIDTTKEVQE